MLWVFPAYDGWRALPAFVPLRTSPFWGTRFSVVQQELPPVLPWAALWLISTAVCAALHWLTLFPAHQPTLYFPPGIFRGPSYHPTFRLWGAALHQHGQLAPTVASFWAALPKLQAVPLSLTKAVHSPQNEAGAVPLSSTPERLPLTAYLLE